MSNPKRILVIEDDESIRQSLEDLLKQEGYVVECARNGEEGIQSLRQRELLPDLILLDLMMPIMDGFQFRMEQRENLQFASIPVIIMTADARAEEKKSRLGVQKHINKPLDIDRLLEVVKQCL